MAHRVYYVLLSLSDISRLDLSICSQCSHSVSAINQFLFVKFDFLQPPVIDRTGLPMSGLTIDVCNTCIPLNHCEVRMTEQRLKSEKVPFIAEIGDRECVAESMGIDVFNSRSLGNTLQ